MQPSEVDSHGWEAGERGQPGRTELDTRPHFDVEGGKAWSPWAGGVPSKEARATGSLGTVSTGWGIQPQFLPAPVSLLKVDFLWGHHPRASAAFLRPEPKHCWCSRALHKG